MQPDPDPTVRIAASRRTAEPGRDKVVPTSVAAVATRRGGNARRRFALASVVGAVLGVALLAGIWAWSAHDSLSPVAPHSQRVATAPPATLQRPHPAPIIDTAFASTTDLYRLAVNQATMLRLRENDRIFVLLFPDLATQAATLNRLAALVEKAGLPRDRIADQAALGQFIARQGETAETWYLGHDYAGADIARFFAIAARDGADLAAEELWLRDRFREARALVPAGDEIAMISVPNAGTGVDPEMRRAIIDHEIGHGHFFTRPDVAVHVVDVWRRLFDAAERAAVIRFLAHEGYDTGNEILLANEAMAYLIFTPDPRFFSAEILGIPPHRLAAMRAKMQQGFPALDRPAPREPPNITRQ
jgi:hypothetical protein